ncbi:MAG: hypothetical protein WC663_03450 [Patescibacteria group bacterium]|jgi:hypothetical protein
MVNEQNQIQNQEGKKQKREKVLKIVFGIIFGILVLGLGGYLIAFLATDNLGFKNYISFKKDKKTEEIKTNESANEQKENINENTNIVNENVNSKNEDITSDWLEFDIQGISFLYPEVLDQSKKVRQIDIPGERKYDFYDFGIFGVGIINNDANESLKDVITYNFDQDNLLQLENVKIGKDQKINALKVTVTDEYSENYGVLGIKYFFANGGKVYTITPGQSFPTKEAEDYYVKNNLKTIDALIETIQIKN